jgi:hypothetical protein
VVLAGQSYRSLGNEDQRDRLVSAVDALVLFGSSTPDELVRLAGTVLENEAVWQVEQGQLTGRASLTRRHRAKVEPNLIRGLQVGEAVVISRGRAAHMLVLPAPGRGQPAAGTELPPPAWPSHPGPPHTPSSARPNNTAPERPPAAIDPWPSSSAQPALDGARGPRPEKKRANPGRREQGGTP